ncbi:MAG TPA: hypothetical protein VGX91_13545 [Candidatus Cybelea sp.]|jgi:hypothetical protein|nr:hypothetical protein [Candidatus Cybelea sp.]
MSRIGIAFAVFLGTVPALFGLQLVAVADAQAANGTTAFLCNKTGQQIIAQYTLAAGKPLTLPVVLQPQQTGCLAVSIPNYAGPITFTGTFGNRHFATKTLTAAANSSLYITFALAGCTAAVANKACLQLI